MDVSVLSQVIRSIFFSFVFLSSLLLLGTVLRSKVKLFQKLYLPASVLGGFIGLILGPIVLKQKAILPIPGDWLTISSLLPGLLIIPVVASVPLGLKFSSKSELDNGNSRGVMRPILITFLLLGLVASVQNFLSLLIAGGFKNFGGYSNIYPTFGTELSAGFAGGHGTAGIIGNLLQSMDSPNWEVAQGLTTTTATVGIISGLLIGILLINIAVRKGYTNFISTDSGISEDMRTGLQKDVSKQESAGKETTNSSSIDSLALHIALILGVSGLAFLTTFLLKKAQVPLLSSIPEWAYAILIMYVVWGFMQKMKLDWIVDVKTKTKISSTLTEFAVVAAIVSLPIEAVFVYILPLVCMIIVGLMATVGLAYFLSKKLFNDNWFERSVTVLGTNTGVFLTGLLLLKMVDPDLKSPVLRDYSLAYSINTVTSFILFPVSFGILFKYGHLGGAAFFGMMILIYVLFISIISRNKKKGVARQ